MDSTLLIQFWLYRSSVRPVQEVSNDDGIEVTTTSAQNKAALSIKAILFYLSNIIIIIVFSILPPSESLQTGNILGYFSATLYIGARIPQILLNFKTKSTEGLSVLMFLLSVTGNITYVLAIVMKWMHLDYDMEYFFDNLPWSCGSGGTLFFDFTVIFYFFAFLNFYLCYR